MSLDTVAPFGKTEAPVKSGDPNADLFAKAEILKWNVGKLIQRFRIKGGWMEIDQIVLFKTFGNGQFTFICDPKKLNGFMTNANLSDPIATNRISMYIMAKCITVPSNIIEPIEKPT